MATKKAEAPAKSLFEQIYSGSKEEQKELKKPLVKSAIKDSIRKVYREAKSSLIKAEAGLHATREKVEGYDAQNTLTHHQSIASARFNMAAMEIEYETMFGEKMPELE